MSDQRAPLPTPAPGDGETWRTLPSTVVSDCLDRSGAMDGRIRLLSGRRLLGPAFTVRTTSGDSSVTHRALRDAPPGHVLVLSAEGGLERAVWGGVLTEAALRCGLVGAVVDGVVRDLAQIRALDFPLFARGSTAAGPHKGGRGTHGQVVQCGGVVVSPGDLVLGDLDGIVVVPAARVDAVARDAVERLRVEESWIERIRSGESSADILGID
jgi:4-hydroxy-4-methyl-2-oxoglutarate aldolase